MNNLLNPEWLWGQLSYIIALLIGGGLVAKQMTRRTEWKKRVIISCASITLLKMGLDLLLVQNLPRNNLGVMVNLSLSLLLYVMISAGTTWCFECDMFAGLFCGTIAYSLQHISQRLYMVYYYAAGNNVHWIINAFVLTVVTVVTYVVLYLVLIRRSRFCTVIVDNKMQIAISTIFIMAVIFLDQFILNAAVTNEHRFQIIALSVATCVLGIMLEMTNMSSRNMELQRDITARLRADEKEKFITDKAIVDLLNIKAHDLKHQLGSHGQTITDEAAKEMQQVLDSYDNLADTGNKALDAILTHKIHQAEQKGIKITFLVDGEKLSFMKDIDIYSLFGNILDNALEAVKALEQEDKRIISISVSAKDYFLSISATNYFSGTIKLVDGLPQTTKQDRMYHGFGMQSIKMLTEKYHGDLNISVKDDIFTLDILFPL